MKIFKSSALSALFCCVSLSAVSIDASAQSSTGSGPNPFRDCGIGAALFPTVHWAAVTSNVIWDVGTTAVISATASPETCQGQNVQAAAFIMETYDILSEETAQGEGKYLETLMSILTVDGKDRQQVLAELRTEMSGIVASPAYAELSQSDKAESYYFALMASL